MVKTTLNINQEIFDLMTETAHSMKIPVSSLIKHVLARFSKYYTKDVELVDSSVTYQKKEAASWHVFPISFSEPEYEQCLDLRKIWKMSVSFFVSTAFLHFLHFPDTEEKNSSAKKLKNSYMLNTYKIRKKLDKNVIMLIIRWGKEEKQPQLE